MYYIELYYIVYYIELSIPFYLCRRHANVVPLMAKGVADLRRELNIKAVLTEMPEIHQFLDGFYMSRIGIRILIGQHIALHEPPKPAHIGLVCTKCSPVQVAQVGGRQKSEGRAEG